MIWKFLFVFSLLTIAAGLIARWYFGLRVIAAEGARPCRPDRTRWEAAVGIHPPLEVAEAPAKELGKLLRLAALAEWKLRDPKRALARASARRFGKAVPPLALIVAVFAVVVRKNLYAVTSVFLAAIAFAILTSLLTIGTELTAIALANRKLRASRTFARQDDEDAVAHSALAQAWLDFIPPILRFL
jgi:hypothetical protein